VTQTKNIALVVLAAAATWGCQFHARSPEDYGKETKALLKTKKGEIKDCYENVLKKDSKAEGVVAVNFKVELKTGDIIDATIDSEKTTAPEPVQKCVLDAMAGLALDPPDAREGVASFSYNFTANEPKQL
jgi:hypothetical protein